MASVELATILISDLCGSTGLQSEVGPARADELRREHFTVLREAIAGTGGREVKNMGDGLMVAFNSASAAAECAVAMQQFMERRNRGADPKLHIRVGVGAGEATVEDGDYFGMPSVEAARLCEKAPVDGILGSALVQMLAGRVDNVRFESAGLLELKGIPEPVEGFAIAWQPLASARAHDELMIGRERELGELEAALDEARAGHGSLWLIAGEAGIGKTRLAEELSTRARAGGVPVIWGRAWDGGGAPAFWPWVQVVQTLSRSRDPGELADDLGTGAPWLAQLVPELRERLPDVEPAPPVEAEQARFALFDALLRFVRSAAARDPLLLVLDDIDTADQSSLLALEYVARSIADVCVLIVGTARTAAGAEALDPGEARAGLAGVGHTIALRGLESDDLARLVDLSTEAEVDDTFVQALHTATGGNPFYVNEVLRVLDVEGGGSGAAVPLPESARDAIVRRLAPLSKSALDVLRAASVIGLEFRMVTVERITGIPRDELLEVLDEAIAAGVITAPDGLLGRLRFAHGLMRETVYSGLSPLERARLNGKVGEAIEALYSGDLDARLSVLAHHFLEAAPTGDPAKAIDYAERAGRRAMDLLAYEEAADLFQRALVALELAPDARRHTAIMLALGQARQGAGDPGSRETLLESAAAARRLGDPKLLAEVALCFGALALSGGLVDDELVQLLEEALEAVGDEPTALRARLLSRLAVALYWSDEADRRRELADEALSIARGAGDTAALAFALANQQLVRQGPDTVEQDLPTLAELFVLTRRSGDRDLELTARSRQIDILLELDDLPRVEGAIAALAEATAERGDPRARVYVPLHRSRQALIEGRFKEAERLTEEAARIGAHLRDSTVPMLVLTQQILRQWIHGRLGEATEQLRGIAAAVPAVFALRAALAVAYASEGHEPEARREMDSLDPEALPRNAIYLLALGFLSEACAEIGDAERSALLYRLLEPYAERNLVSPAATFAGPATRYLGLLAATRGDWTAARAHFGAAREAAARQHATPMLARVCLDEARLLARASLEPERVAELATEAARHARSVGMTAIEAQANQLASVSPGAAPTAEPAAAPALAPDRATLRREGDVWAIGLGGRTVNVPDSEGLRLIALLLARPGVEIHAAELAAEIGNGAGPPLDDAARASYRRRLTHLREAIEEAESSGDPARASGARAEMNFIEDELAGGADRGSASTAERARVRVTRAIRLATRRVGELDRSLGRELDATIRTGTFCAHEPDPRHPVTWQVDA